MRICFYLKISVKISVIGLFFHWNPKYRTYIGTCVRVYQFHGEKCYVRGKKPEFRFKTSLLTAHISLKGKNLLLRNVVCICTCHVLPSAETLRCSIHPPGLSLFGAINEDACATRAENFLSCISLSTRILICIYR